MYIYIYIYNATPSSKIIRETPLFHDSEPPDCPTDEENVCVVVQNTNKRHQRISHRTESSESEFRKMGVRWFFHIFPQFVKKTLIF